MKTFIYLVVLASLLAGCASTGQANVENSSVLKTAVPTIAQPVSTEPSSLASPQLTASPVATEPVDTEPAATETVATETVAGQATSGAVIAAYDHDHKGYTLRPVNLDTGKDLPGFEPIPVSLGTDYTAQGIYSPDGRKLAVVESRGDSCELFAGGLGCYPRAIALHLIDLASWQAISTTLPSDGWAGTVTFSPAGDRLALSYNRQKGNEVLLLNPSDGQILSELALGFRPEKIAFYQGGNGLLAWGTLPGKDPGVTQPGPLHLEAYTVPSGEKQWELDLKDVTSGFWCLEGCESEHGKQLYANWAPAIVLAPDGNMLYIYQANQERLTQISVADGSREDVEVRQAQSWIERLLSATAGVALAKGGSEGTTRQGVISPDGQRLYVLSTTTHSEVNKDGFWEPTDVTTELQVIDPQSGQMLGRKPASGYGIRLSPDGKYLFVDDWLNDGMQSEIWDAESLKSIASSDGWELRYTPDLDGNMRLLGKWRSNTFAVFETDSFQPLKSWKYPSRAYLAAIS